MGSLPRRSSVLMRSRPTEGVWAGRPSEKWHVSADKTSREPSFQEAKLSAGKRGRHERVDCRHRRKKHTETAGLRRTVCQRCGAVTVHFLYDVFAEEQKQLAEHG